MRGYCFWCGALLDHHDSSNPAYARFDPHEPWPDSDVDWRDVERDPVVGKDDKLNETA